MITFNVTNEELVDSIVLNNSKEEIVKLMLAIDKKIGECDFSVKFLAEYVKSLKTDFKNNEIREIVDLSL